MEMTVDGKPVRANAFVQKIVTNITWSVIDSLDDVPENPQSVSITFAGESPIKLTVDGQDIRMNPFVQKVSRNIIAGLIRSLDDIPENPQSIILETSKK